MTRQALIVGGGIGGLAAAIACERAGWQARLYEQAAQFSEAGAGIQLGPNATRVLGQWGLADDLARIAAFPEQLVVRTAVDGGQLGRLRLGSTIAARYGSTYATVHRADLQRLLLAQAERAGTALNLSCAPHAVPEVADAVRIRLPDGTQIEGDALVGADGLWSHVRSLVCGDHSPRFTGHLAYRAVVAQGELPQTFRSQEVTVWLGPRMHLVAYPVRGGEELNVVVLVEGQVRDPAALRDWDQDAVASELQAAMGPLCGPLRDLVAAMPHWRLWALHDLPPLSGPDEMAGEQIALLGDAAHPMLPYFAQGAGMALEDAAQLQQVFGMVRDGVADVPLALRRYALARWQRCARVQALSRRNGRVFHASGFVRWGRDVSMRLLGERLLDQPWLYR